MSVSNIFNNNVHSSEFSIFMYPQSFEEQTVRIKWGDLNVVSASFEHASSSDPCSRQTDQFDGECQHEIPDSLFEQILSLESELRDPLKKGPEFKQQSVPLKGKVSAHKLVENWVNDFYNQKPEVPLSSLPQSVNPCKRKNKESVLCSFPLKKRRLNSKEESKQQRQSAAVWKETILKWMEQDLQCHEGYRSILGRLSFQTHGFLASALEVMAFISRNGLNCAERKCKERSIILVSSSQDLPLRVIRKLLSTAIQNLTAVDEITSPIDPGYPKKVLDRNYDPYRSWCKWKRKRAALHKAVAQFNRNSPFAFENLSKGEEWEGLILRKDVSWLEIVWEFFMRNRV